VCRFRRPTRSCSYYSVPRRCSAPSRGAAYDSAVYTRATSRRARGHGRQCDVRLQRARAPASARSTAEPEPHGPPRWPDGATHVEEVRTPALPADPRPSGRRRRQATRGQRVPFWAPSLDPLIGVCGGWEPGGAMLLAACRGAVAWRPAEPREAVPSAASKNRIVVGRTLPDGRKPVSIALVPHSGEHALGF
jgi:hypothetical protein